jgi:hypothetical protein
MQNGAILRNAAQVRNAETPSVGNGAQTDESPRQNSLFN